jgi:hypothetical protein
VKEKFQCFGLVIWWKVLTRYFFPGAVLLVSVLEREWSLSSESREKVFLLKLAQFPLCLGRLFMTLKFQEGFFLLRSGVIWLLSELLFRPKKAV